MHDEDERLLTLREASARIGVASDTLQKQAKQGRLRARLIGMQWLVTVAEIDRYAREQKGNRGRPRKSPVED
jgi:excisionase family DNA binding protein